MKALELNTVESSELVEQTFRFWFSDQDHIRSPFPTYIQPELKQKATRLFFDWASTINPKAKEELNDEMVGEKFEELIFETASNLVKTEDERITILYPFLPRIGDTIQIENEPNSKIIDRSILKEGDNGFLKVILRQEENNRQWETKFELPHVN